MTTLQLKIITKAVQIRVNNGEDIYDVLNSYIKLTEEEKQSIKDKITL